MNSVALITGGSRGIGRGIALELARIGWDLVLNYCSNKTAAERTAADWRIVGAVVARGRSNRADDAPDGRYRPDRI